jgi:2-phosphosulfolactate phosphatase
MSRLHVHLLPDLVAEEELAGATVVVIDVLRATTTILYALAAGARQVVPCLEIEAARQIRDRLPRGEVLLGGERGGVKIEGFDLGNSPEEYTPEIVGGRTIAFTTTNGTRAMLRCTRARRVLVGGFVNLSAVQQAIEPEEHVAILCAGTDGRITAEDALAAGLLVACRRHAGRYDFAAGSNLPALNDQGVLALGLAKSRRSLRDFWQATPAARRAAPSGPKRGNAGDLQAKLAAFLRCSLGGRNLTALGCQADLRAAARLDRFDFIPELNLADWAIRRP